MYQGNFNNANYIMSDILPYEDIIEIAQYLPPDDIINLCRTNYKFSRLCDDWHFWSDIAYREFKIRNAQFYTDNPKFKPYDRYLYVKNLLINPIKNFYESIKQNDIEGFNILLDRINDVLVYNRGILSASSNGRLEILNILLNLKGSDPSYGDNLAIRSACKYGHLDIVKRLLLDSRACHAARPATPVDPTDYDNEAIVEASRYGHVDIVNVLLQDKRVDPSEPNNESLIEASRNGYVNVVDRLLQDERVDPSDQNNEAIILASMNGHLDVVIRLLEDDRVDPSDQDDHAIRSALQNKHFDLVNLLLTDRRVMDSLPTTQVNQIKQYISRYI